MKLGALLPQLLEATGEALPTLLPRLFDLVAGGGEVVVQLEGVGSAASCPK